MKIIIRFFDKLEDRVRIYLSHYPIAYALIGSIGIVLMWKGVEETARLFPVLYGPVSFILGALILLVSGLLVSFFVGDNIIISGFRQEKKLAEKTEEEIEEEQDKTELVLAELQQLKQDIADLKVHHTEQ